MSSAPNEGREVSSDHEISLNTEIVECPHVIFNQLGNPVCFRNPEAPGYCTPHSCPYEAKEKGQ